MLSAEAGDETSCRRKRFPQRNSARPPAQARYSISGSEATGSWLHVGIMPTVTHRPGSRFHRTRFSSSTSECRKLSPRTGKGSFSDRRRTLSPQCGQVAALGGSCFPARSIHGTNGSGRGLRGGLECRRREACPGASRSSGSLRLDVFMPGLREKTSRTCFQTSVSVPAAPKIISATNSFPNRYQPEIAGLASNVFRIMAKTAARTLPRHTGQASMMLAKSANPLVWGSGASTCRLQHWFWTVQVRHPRTGRSTVAGAARTKRNARRRALGQLRLCPWHGDTSGRREDAIFRRYAQCLPGTPLAVYGGCIVPAGGRLIVCGRVPGLFMVDSLFRDAK